MKLTVPVPVRDFDVGKEQATAWVNDEARPLLRQLRQWANFFSVERHVSESTDGAGGFLRLWTSPVMPTNGVWLIAASTVGAHVSGAAQSSGLELRIVVQSAAGTLTAVGAGSTITLALRSSASIFARFVVDAANRNVYLEARDDGTSPMRFTAVVTTNEVTP